MCIFVLSGTCICCGHIKPNSRSRSLWGTWFHILCLKVMECPVQYYSCILFVSQTDSDCTSLLLCSAIQCVEGSAQ